MQQQEGSATVREERKQGPPDRLQISVNKEMGEPNSRGESGKSIMHQDEQQIRQKDRQKQTFENKERRIAALTAHSSQLTSTGMT